MQSLRVHFNPNLYFVLGVFVLYEQSEQGPQNVRLFVSGDPTRRLRVLHCHVPRLGEIGTLPCRSSIGL